MAPKSDRVSYPYGEDYFLRSRPLTAQEKFDKAEQASWDTQSKQDRLVMWVCLGLLSLVYCALDAGLLLWLAGF